MLPLEDDGLRLLRGRMTESLAAHDFAGFGQEVLAPADGRVVCVADGAANHARAGVYPENTDHYLEDFRRAAGRCVVLDHGEGVYSCLGHLRNGSLRVREGRQVSAGDLLGELGNSGFSSGPHLHLHFMDGPDMLTASPLPIQLQAEGSVFTPQAGQIIAP
jgi:murein DD-endopeptidase MepM/ murein hydrolase activator NlpD